MHFSILEHTRRVQTLMFYDRWPALLWVISEIPCTSADLASEGSNGLMSAVYTPNLAYTNDKQHNLTFLKS